MAIRPLKECDPSLLKNLKEGLVYKFYQDLEVFINQGKGQEIKLDNDNYSKYTDVKISRVCVPKNSIDLYSGTGPKINISAIVGKNGSGKSAITEIFLKAMFDLSIENKIITEEKIHSQFAKDREFLESRIEDLEHSIEILEGGGSKYEGNFFNRVTELGFNLSKDRKSVNDFDHFVKKLSNYQKSDLYFELIGQFDSEKPFIIRKSKGDKKISIEGIDPVGEKYPYKNLFYTIFLNYSIYGLNAYEIGDWIDFLYHKNDGYQTPVVINPQKTDGNIDVNKEEELSRYRINRSAVSNGRILDLEIQELTFEIKEKKHNYKFEYDWETDTLYAKNKPENTEFQFELNGNSESEFLNKVSGSEGDFKSNDFPLVLVKYFLGKLFKTDYLYKLNAFTYDKERSIYKLTGLSTYCQQTICKSTTHKLLKLRQVIDILRNKLELAEELFEYANKKIWIQFYDFKKKLNEEEELDLQISFTSIFNVDYKFKDGSTYSSFSSGQKQFVNTLETINYHIKNLSSNNEYKAINIILDEVELYFHPEFQRVLIKKLIDSIGTLNLTSDYSINVLFLTHSPFILSDIPSSNILRLEKGVPADENFNQTFSANIHDMFLSSFFMSSTIGAVAEDKIIELVHFHKSVTEAPSKERIDALRTIYLEENQDFSTIVNLIGDEVVQRILENNLIQIEEKLGVGDFIKSKIKALQTEIEKLSNPSNDVTH